MIVLEEYFDTELVIVETLERLVNDLNYEDANVQHQSSAEIKRMKLDHDKKMRHKEDLIKSKDKRLKLF